MIHVNAKGQPIMPANKTRLPDCTPCPCGVCPTECVMECLESQFHRLPWFTNLDALGFSSAAVNNCSVIVDGTAYDLHLESTSNGVTGTTGNDRTWHFTDDETTLYTYPECAAQKLNLSIMVSKKNIAARSIFSNAYLIHNLDHADNWTRPEHYVTLDLNASFDAYPHYVYPDVDANTTTGECDDCYAPIKCFHNSAIATFCVYTWNAGSEQYILSKRIIGYVQNLTSNHVLASDCTVLKGKPFPWSFGTPGITTDVGNEENYRGTIFMDEVFPKNGVEDPDWYGLTQWECLLDHKCRWRKLKLWFGEYARLDEESAASSSGFTWDAEHCYYGVQYGQPKCSCPETFFVPTDDHPDPVDVENEDSDDPGGGGGGGSDPDDEDVIPPYTPEPDNPDGPDSPENPDNPHYDPPPDHDDPDDPDIPPNPFDPPDNPNYKPQKHCWYMWTSQCVDGEWTTPVTDVDTGPHTTGGAGLCYTDADAAANGWTANTWVNNEDGTAYYMQKLSTCDTCYDTKPCWKVLPAPPPKPTFTCNACVAEYVWFRKQVWDSGFKVYKISDTLYASADYNGSIDEKCLEYNSTGGGYGCAGYWEHNECSNCWYNRKVVNGTPGAVLGTYYIRRNHPNGCGGDEPSADYQVIVTAGGTEPVPENLRQYICPDLLSMLPADLQ